MFTLNVAPTTVIASPIDDPITEIADTPVVIHGNVRPLSSAAPAPPKPANVMLYTLSTVNPCVDVNTRGVAFDTADTVIAVVLCIDCNVPEANAITGASTDPVNVTFDASESTVPNNAPPSIPA